MPFAQSFSPSTLRLAVVPVAAACLIQAYAAPSHAELPPSAAVEAQPSPEARQQFQLGVSLLQDPDGPRYEDAFKAFLRAYQITPSWKILGNLGLSALKLERYTDGIEAYERYLAEGGQSLDAAERQQIEKDLSIMKGTSGTLTLIVTGASKVRLEDTRARSVGGPVINLYDVPHGGRIVLELAAGAHSLAVSGEGKSASLKLDVAAGESAEHTLELTSTAPSAAPVTSNRVEATRVEATGPEEAPPSSTLRTTGLIVGGVGVAALIGGGVTAMLGMSKKSDLDARCPNDECPYGSPEEKASIESDQDSLRTFGALTTALLAGGGVLTAAGVTLFVVGGPSESERVSVSPAFGPGVAGLSAQGAF